jgi:hypothetical protein
MGMRRKAGTVSSKKEEPVSHTLIGRMIVQVVSVLDFPTDFIYGHRTSKIIENFHVYPIQFTNLLVSTTFAYFHKNTIPLGDAGAAGIENGYHGAYHFLGRLVEVAQPHLRPTLEFFDET